MMKGYILLLLLMNCFVFNSISQKTPIFVGTKYIKNNSMTKDQVDIWNYKGFVFKTITPGIARPVIYTEIYNKGKNGQKLVKNVDLFGENNITVIEMVNSALLDEYSIQREEDPNCYPGFQKVDFNQLSISVDNNFMYFDVTWNSSYLTDSSNECFNPSTTAKISLTDVAAWGVLGQFINTK